MRLPILLCAFSLRVEAHLGKDTGGGLTKWFEPTDTLFVRFYAKRIERFPCAIVYRIMDETNASLRLLA